MKQDFYERVQQIIFDAIIELEDRILMGVDVKILTCHLTSTIPGTGEVFTRFICGYDRTIRRQYVQNALIQFHFSDKRGRLYKPVMEFRPYDVPLRTLANKDYHEHAFYYREFTPVEKQEFVPTTNTAIRFRKGRHQPTKIPIIDESPGPGFAFTIHDTPNTKTEKLLLFFQDCLEKNCPFARSFMWITQPVVNPHNYDVEKTKLYNSILLTFSQPLTPDYQNLLAKKTRDYLVQALVDFYAFPDIKKKNNPPVKEPSYLRAGIVRRPQNVASFKKSQDIERFLLIQLQKSNPDYLKQLQPRVYSCINALINQNSWTSPLKSRLERMQNIAKEVEAKRMDIRRYEDNLVARWVALVLYLVFDWSIFKIDALLLKEWELDIMANANKLMDGKLFKEFNRYVRIKKLKNDAQHQKKLREHVLEQYNIEIVRHLSADECKLLTKMMRDHGRDKSKKQLFEVLCTRSGEPFSDASRALDF